MLYVPTKFAMFLPKSDGAHMSLSNRIRWMAYVTLIMIENRLRKADLENSLFKIQRWCPFLWEVCCFTLDSAGCLYFHVPTLLCRWDYSRINDIASQLYVFYCFLKITGSVRKEGLGFSAVCLPRSRWI